MKQLGFVRTRRGGSAETVRRTDRGSATVLVMAMGALIVACGLLGAGLGAALVARHRAAMAADFGALAAALHVADGGEEACRHAAMLVSENGGTLTSCEISGMDAVVEVAVRLPGEFAGFGSATARSKAGPVRDAGP